MYTKNCEKQFQKMAKVLMCANIFIFGTKKTLKNSNRLLNLAGESKVDQDKLTLLKNSFLSIFKFSSVYSRVTVYTTFAFFGWLMIHFSFAEFCTDFAGTFVESSTVNQRSTIIQFGKQICPLNLIIR